MKDANDKKGPEEIKLNRHRKHHRSKKNKKQSIALYKLLYILQLILYADDAKIYNHILNRQDKDTLLNDLIKLKSWADNWLINLNIAKCKTVSYGRNVDNTYPYCINNTEFEYIESIKDLGVTFESRLKISLHINEEN